MNSKETGKIEYYLQALLMSYHQNASNNCCLSSLASAFTVSAERNSEGAIEIQIEE